MALQDLHGGRDFTSLGKLKGAQDFGLPPPAASRVEPAYDLSKLPRRAVSLLKKPAKIEPRKQRGNQHPHCPKDAAGVNGRSEMPPTAGARHGQYQQVHDHPIRPKNPEVGKRSQQRGRAR